MSDVLTLKMIHLFIKFRAHCGTNTQKYTLNIFCHKAFDSISFHFIYYLCGVSGVRVNVFLTLFAEHSAYFTT